MHSLSIKYQNEQTNAHHHRVEAVLQLEGDV
jgi:hypothetical protein